MLFSSLVFLWYFLPAVFLLYFITKNLHIRNGVLLAASLFFYAWGEPKYVILMLVSIGLNYFFGLWIGRMQSKHRMRLAVTTCVFLNLLLLGYFKYFNFAVEIANSLLSCFAGGAYTLSFREIALPVGISFYTFQALSYVVDVYRGTIQAQKNIFHLALYISFFPQLIAGPIVKYHDVCEQIGNRQCTAEGMAYGIKRFSYGLAKKMLFANTFAATVDWMMEKPLAQLGTVNAWMLAVLYTLQIYFDFSGYSDMAIGLGKMFGFDFMENFNYPYISTSIREFWRRWHISLSTWFREYLYIPLKSKWILYQNVIIHRHLKIWSQHSPNGMNGTAAFPILLLQFDKEQLCTGCFHTSYCLFAKCFLRKQSLHCNISLFRALPYSGLCFQISVYKFTDCHLFVHDIYK